MKIKNISLLICPNCCSDKLEIKSYKSSENEIDEGILLCQSCKIWYRIENGILDFLPLGLRRDNLYSNFANKYKLNFEVIENKSIAEEDKISQMNFFGEKVSHYEKQVSNSNYYKALDSTVFIEWIKKNLKTGYCVLDLGCGTGRQCILLAQYGIQNIGIDISEEMLLEAKRKIDKLRLSQYVDFIVGDALNPPVKDNTFNACVLYGTLHHLHNKHMAITNGSKKLLNNGLFYSLDPSNSPLRFIFDSMMKIWKLYEDKASKSSLLSERQLKEWLIDAGIENKIKFSTYLPPHLFYLLSVNINIKLLRFTDQILNRIPFIRTFGGAIIAEGVKTPNLDKMYKK